MVSAYPRVDSSQMRFEIVTKNDGYTETSTSRSVLAAQRLYRDGPTVPRKRPSVPVLYPTALERMSFKQTLGAVNLVAQVGRERVWVLNGAFRSTAAYTNWGLVPGVSVLGNGSPVITRVLDDQNLLKNKVLAKIKDMNLSLPTFLGESKQTASWLARRVSSSARAIAAVKKGKWKDIKAAVRQGEKDQIPREVTFNLGRYGYKPVRKSASARDLPGTPPDGWSSKPAAERWLEVEYAVKPLLSDAENAAKALAQYLFDNKLELIHRYARSLYYRERQNLFEYTTGPTQFVNYPTCNVRQGSAVRTKIDINYVLDPSYFSQMLATSKTLGLTNLASTAYELVPYSFVLDWGATIGDYLELLDATVGCNFVSGSMSRKLTSRSLDWTVKPHHGTTNHWKVVLTNTTPALITADLYHREVLDSFPTPQVVVKSPLSAAHMASAIALVRVSFKR